MVQRLCMLLLCIFCASAALAQQYYVVIGAFAVESNARKFTGYARNQRFDAAYKLNALRNLHYVYVMKTTNRKEAYAEAVRLQTKTEFTDAWVFYGYLGNEAASEQPSPVSAGPVQQQEPVQEKKNIPAEIPGPALEEAKKEPAQITETVNKSGLPPPKGKYFRFRITTTDGRPVPGEVHHVDRVRQADIATYKTEQLIDLVSPPQNQPLTIVCGIFGFKEIVKVIDYNDPATSAEAVQGSDGEWIITYKLEPLKKGDVQVMYNVSFYKDAAIMTPQSKTELDELVNMMKLNPNYRIKIHGHCNGNYNKRLIKYPGKKKNYFSMTGAEDKNGSSKELSRVRAETIQNYLLDNGIDKSRMEIFAWGGTNMLVSETSTSARLNDRIEIEILQD